MSDFSPVSKYDIFVCWQWTC